MRIWHISDTHCLQHQITKIPDVDIVFHSGDASNNKEPGINTNEMLGFIDWYKNLNIPTKIFVAGNHDTSIEKRMVRKENFESNGILYLENEEIIINGLKIWGSPYTPNFGEWSFMKDRAKIYRVWETIPDDVDILILHGPPKGIRDLSYDRQNNLEMCGDSSLTKRIKKLQNLKLVCFGHIHNVSDVFNQGYGTHNGSDVIFSNAACSTDRNYDNLTSFGNIITLS